MKIIQVVPYYPPHLGGMENVAREVSEKLSDKGYEIEVLTSNIGHKTVGLEQSHKFKVHHLGSFEVAHTPIIPLLFFKLLKLPKDCLIHSHVATAFTPEIVYLASKLRGFRYICHIHLDVDPSGRLGFLLEPYKKYILKIVLKNASKVICLTSEQKEFISKKYDIPHSQISIVPNGVSEEFFIKRNRIGRNKKIKLLFVGRLAIQKNVQLLIQALTFVKSDVFLNIVGDGQDKSMLLGMVRKLKIKNVAFQGIRKGKDLIKFYKNADIFVISSLKEGLSLSMLEAMAAGLPIIGTNVPGIKSLIKKCGIVVNENLPQDFGGSIDKLATNRKLLLRLSKNSKKESENYTWENVVKSLENIYSAL